MPGIIQNYRHSIVAGIAGGILTVAYGVFAAKTAAPNGFSPVCLASLLILVAPGALAVYWNRALLHDLSGTVRPSAAAGLVAGVTNMVISLPILLYVYMTGEGNDVLAQTSLGPGLPGVLAYVLGGIIFAVIGGAIYYVVVGTRPKVKNMRSDHDIDGLIKALDHADVMVRIEASDALAGIGDSRVIGSLVELIKSKDRKAHEAASILKKIGSQEVYDRVNGLLQGTDEAVRLMALSIIRTDYHNDRWNFSLSYPPSWEVIMKDEPAGSWTVPIAVASKPVGGRRSSFMVNVRRGEILQGNANVHVTGMLPDGSIYTAPSTPHEYIELTRKTLAREFAGFQFTSGEEIRLANKPAAKLAYSYDEGRGRVLEESYTIFGVGVTFQFIFEMPEGQADVSKPVLQRILDSFTIGNGTSPEQAPPESTTPLLPYQIYNQGVVQYRGGQFERALASFERCYGSGEYRKQSAYIRALCQRELGRPIEAPADLGGDLEDAGAAYVASNIVCTLIERGYKARLQEGWSTIVVAKVDGSLYKISVSSLMGAFMNMAWRMEDGKSIPLTDRALNPDPTASDQVVISLVKAASSLPPAPIPEKGLGSPVDDG